MPPVRALMQIPVAHGPQSRSLRISAICCRKIISGAAIVSVVLSLPTTGPMLLRALQSQDMYLAGSFLMFLAVLTVIGTLLSDLALAVLDPRIRFGEQEAL